MHVLSKRSTSGVSQGTEVTIVTKYVFNINNKKFLSEQKISFHDHINVSLMSM